MEAPPLLAEPRCAARRTRIALLLLPASLFLFRGAACMITNTPGRRQELFAKNFRESPEVIVRQLLTHRDIRGNWRKNSRGRTTNLEPEGSRVSLRSSAGAGPAHNEP